MQIDDQIFDAVALQVFDRVSDHGAVEKRERGFGPAGRQRPQARSEPGCQNHCFNVTLFKWSVEILQRLHFPFSTRHFSFAIAYGGGEFRDGK